MSLDKAAIVQTCRRTLRTFAYRRRTELIGTRSKWRFWCGRGGAPIPQVSYCTVTRKLWVSCANRRADDPTNDPNSRLSPLGGCSPRRAGLFFDRPISAMSRGEHLTFQVKPKRPAGCKMVGTVKGAKLVGG